MRLIFVKGFAEFSMTTLTTLNIQLSTGDNHLFGSRTRWAGADVLVANGCAYDPAHQGGFQRGRFAIRANWGKSQGKVAPDQTGTQKQRRNDSYEKRFHLELPTSLPRDVVL